ncbi:hypothetical protein BS47DRAFT_1392339 [Hydnum rufescens UP504]|uniref:Uncharacterized protein n=1 Tax=Hydnum rufescens UP504 TaxID=1448309 RepID=A0A9P6AZ91_9AGAM|nr:hypothetical protein BS47DRAFT_1392339 [Hydnum rufescens UP504]
MTTTQLPVIQVQQEEYEVWRLWDDCLALQRDVEKEYTRLSSVARESPSDAMRPANRAASFVSLPFGSDRLSVSSDVHDAGVPKLTKKIILFRGITIEQRGDEFGSFLLALFASNHPIVIQVLRMPTVRDFFAWWKRDRDSSAQVASPGPSSGLTRTVSLGSVTGESKPGSRSTRPSTSSSPPPLPTRNPGRPIPRRPSTAPGGLRPSLFSPASRIPSPEPPPSKKTNGLRIDTNGLFPSSSTLAPQSASSLLTVDPLATATSGRSPPPQQTPSNASNGIANRPRSNSPERYDCSEHDASPSTNTSRAGARASRPRTLNLPPTVHSPVQEEEEEQLPRRQDLSMSQVTHSHEMATISREGPLGESTTRAVRRTRSPNQQHGAENRSGRVFEGFMRDFQIISPTQEEFSSVMMADTRPLRPGQTSGPPVSPIASSARSPNSVPSSPISGIGRDVPHMASVHRSVRPSSLLVAAEQFFGHTDREPMDQSPLEASRCWLSAPRADVGDPLSPKSHAESRAPRSPTHVLARKSFVEPRQNTNFPRVLYPLEEPDGGSASQSPVLSVGQDELVNLYMHGRGRSGSGSSHGSVSVRGSLQTLDTPPPSRRSSASFRPSFLDLTHTLLSLDEEPDTPLSLHCLTTVQVANPERSPGGPFQKASPGHFRLSRQVEPSSSANPIPMMFTAKAVHVPSGSAVLVKLPRNVVLEEVQARIAKRFHEVEALELSWSLPRSILQSDVHNKSLRRSALYCRNHLAPPSPPSPPSSPGRKLQHSPVDSPDLSYMHIVTQADWARAVASIGSGEKMSLRIFEEERCPTSAI